MPYTLSLAESRDTRPARSRALGLFQDALSHRDRSVLRAIAAGRCTQPGPGCLTVDGVALADQFAGLRLCDAGLVTAAAGRVALTESGRALLSAA